MKSLLVVFAVVLSAACNHPDNSKSKASNSGPPNNRDSLTSYAPGLGEFMLGFQVHHAKLWFAGQGNNWPLADFEIKEIDELRDDIQKYCTDRTEIKFLPMLKPAVDSIKTAVLEKNLKKFRTAYYNLTKACNDCHQVVNFSFNIICIPKNPPFSNQRYTAPD